MSNTKSPKGTPPKNSEKPDEEYYDKRGAILSARKRTRSSTRQQRPKLSDDLDPGDDCDQETVYDQKLTFRDLPRKQNID